MSTTPPPEPPIDTGPRSYGGGGVTVDVARLPVPGNAEFALYLLALILAWIIVWTMDALDASDFFFYDTATTEIYTLSRGIAKASRVLED